MHTIFVIGHSCAATEEIKKSVRSGQPSWTSGMKICDGRGDLAKEGPGLGLGTAMGRSLF